MQNTNYTIAESYTLPSKGIIYDIPFDPTVTLRSMTIMEEMKRLSHSEGTNRVLCEIIDACLIDKLPISVYDMCIGDYEYLLHKLRVVTYGPEYKMAVGCPHKGCQSVYTETFNLDELTNKEFKKEDLDNSLNFILPGCKKEITLRLETPRLQDTIYRKINERKMEAEKYGASIDDPTILVTLECMIDKVDGKKMSYIELQEFIKTLSARDYNVINQKITKSTNLIGLNKEINVTCGKCGKMFKTFFRFSSEFFRPEID
jgi:hypothetical protein